MDGPENGTGKIVRILSNEILALLSPIHWPSSSRELSGRKIGTLLAVKDRAKDFWGQECQVDIVSDEIRADILTVSDRFETLASLDPIGPFQSAQHSSDHHLIWNARLLIWND